MGLQSPMDWSSNPRPTTSYVLLGRLFDLTFSFFMFWVFSLRRWDSTPSPHSIIDCSTLHSVWQSVSAQQTLVLLPPLSRRKKDFVQAVYLLLHADFPAKAVHDRVIMCGCRPSSLQISSTLPQLWFPTSAVQLLFLSGKAMILRSFITHLDAVPSCLRTDHL